MGEGAIKRLDVKKLSCTIFISIKTYKITFEMEKKKNQNPILR